MIGQETSYLRDRTYGTVALTHFFVDVLNNGRTLLVAGLALSLGLSNAQVGITVILYNVGSALSQPFFGLIADRFGPRWLVVGGISWMVGLYSVAAVAGDWLALAAVTLASLGSGSFHPSGTKMASESSHVARNQATAVFFFSGQIGLFLGPLIAGVLLTTFGQSGYLFLAAAAMTAVVMGRRWVVNGHAWHREQPETGISQMLATASFAKIPFRTVIPLVTIIVTTSTLGISTLNFAPKLFTELTYAPIYVGTIAGLFMLGSAVGGIVGGRIGDHVGRKTPVLIGTLGTVIPVYLYIGAGDLARLNLLLIAGFFAGMPHSILVITAQSLLPGRRAFASGLTLGLMFFSGAIGSFILGLYADKVGLANALQAMAVLPLIAAVAAIFFPNRNYSRSSDAQST
jgi:FSR family fosmidomycin resistance protein-like MFS transporter